MGDHSKGRHHISRKITIGSVATVGAIAVICAAFWIGFTAAHSWAQGISTR